MGSSISAKKLTLALEKAKNISIVEEEVAIGGSLIVVRSLRPSEYEDINKSLAGITDEVEYLNTWQRGQVSRAIVEVNGVSLRGVQFIEDEETDAKGNVQTVKLELHSYLLKNLISTWGKEAVYTVWRKVGDAISRAETETNASVRFLIPEETPEERFRRILGDLKEIEDEVPNALVDSILADVGLMRKSTAEEIKLAMEREGELAFAEIERQRKLAEATEVAARPEPAPPVAPVRRVPLNQVAVVVPPPPVAQRTETVPASRVPTKAEKYAALEADADQIGALGQGPLGVEMPTEVAILEGRQQGINPSKAGEILERPPTVGLNPKFRPPPR